MVVVVQSLEHHVELEAPDNVVALAMKQMHGEATCEELEKKCRWA